MNNGKKVLSNLIWKFAERCGAQMVAFVVSIVLARILEPDAYGTVALVTVITTILQVFVNSGLGNALIQKKDADEVDFSTVFFTNVVFCTVLYIALFMLAPYIAVFYNDITLTPYIRVLGLTVLISGVKNVQQAYVSKHLMFKKFFYATLGGTIAAAIIGIAMAYMGFGVWALVAQQVVNTLIDTIVLWVTVKWRPSRCFSFTRLKTLFSFGSRILASSLLDTIYNELRQLIIGKLYTSADLAYYNQGMKFPNLIVSNVNVSIDSVLLPVMADVQDDLNRVKGMMRKSLTISTYVMAPLMMGLAFISEPVVSLILTDKWLPCVPYLRIFCIIFMFRPINSANLNAITALGRSDLLLKLEIVKKAIGLIVLLATMRYGVMAMAYSLFVVEVLGQITNSWPNRKLLGYSYIEQIKDILPSILLALFMGVCIYPISMIEISDILVIAFQVILGAMIYIVGSMVLKLEPFQYLWEIVKPIMLKFVRKGEMSDD